MDLYRECMTWQKMQKISNYVKWKMDHRTITYKIIITNIVKFDQMIFSIKIDAFWSCAIDDADFLFLLI